MRRKRSLRQRPHRTATELATMAYAAKTTLVTVERISESVAARRREFRRRRAAGALCRRRSREHSAAPGRSGCGANIRPTTPRSRATPRMAKSPEGFAAYMDGFRATARGGRVSLAARDAARTPDRDHRGSSRPACVSSRSALPRRSLPPAPCCCAPATRRAGCSGFASSYSARASIISSPTARVELFDCAAQGRVDAFFLGGGQIDGQGNINLVGTGDYPQNDVRWPGSFGSAFLYYRRAARDPVSRGALAARVRRQGRFHQRARRERRRRPQWRALRTADGPGTVRFRQIAKALRVEERTSRRIGRRRAGEYGVSTMTRRPMSRRRPNPTPPRWRCCAGASWRSSPRPIRNSPPRWRPSARPEAAATRALRFRGRSATWSSPRISAGAIGMPSRVRARPRGMAALAGHVDPVDALASARCCGNRAPARRRSP